MLPQGSAPVGFTSAIEDAVSIPTRRSAKAKALDFAMRFGLRLSTGGH